MIEGVTVIVLPVSRREYLDKVFSCLEYLECVKEETSLLVIVDGDPSLYVDVRNRTEFSKFGQRLCVEYRDGDRVNHGSTQHRRNRIAKIHNFAKTKIKRAEYVFCIEDDGSFRPDTLLKLQKDYFNYPFAGLIAGVEVGRWGIKAVGGWKVDDIYNPTRLESIPLGKGLQEVDGTGLYCTLMKGEDYQKHEFKPFEDALGPDADLGFTLRRSGRLNYIDFDVPVIHLTKQGELKPTEADLVYFTKIENRWRQRTEVIEA